MKRRAASIIAIVTILISFLSSCKVRKNEDFVIIFTEAQRIQAQLKASKGPITKEVLENTIHSASVDGIIRWDISPDPKFWITSKKHHSAAARKPEAVVFWKIDKNLNVVRVQ